MKQLLGLIIIFAILYIIDFSIFTFYPISSYGVGESVTTDNKIQRYNYFRSEDPFGNVSVRKWDVKVVGYVTYKDTSAGGKITKCIYGKDTIRIASNTVHWTEIKKHYY
jgi:hypothetical protein